jgi:hypothetical protein
VGYSSKTFVCPFFKWDERLRVHCEGGCLSFHDRPEAEDYIDRHCADLEGWKCCSLACSLLRYYERTE